MGDRALADASQVVVGVARAQRIGLLDGQPGGHVAVERVVRGGLVGDDVDVDIAADQLGQDLGGVAQQADRQRPPLAAAPQPRQRVVEVGRALVEVAGLHAALDALQVDLDAQRGAAAHRDRQRLGAAHAAEPGGDDQAAAQRAAEALARDRGERLVGALQDPLAPDVDPGARGHLPVHHQPGRVELAELLPRRPVGDEVRVGDQHARGALVGLEHGHRLARLHEQRLVVAQRHQLAADRA